MLFLEERYLHPSGQLPAYEWNFSDVNPPIHPIAVFMVYLIDKENSGGEGDIEFLKRGFDRLVLNFNWWVAKKDPMGKNAFEGGFLGLDNIGVFDRSSALPTGGTLEQSDGTAWMVLFAQSMLRMALELAEHDSNYEDWALKALDQFINIAAAMERVKAAGGTIYGEPNEIPGIGLYVAGHDSEGNNFAMLQPVGGE